MTIQDKINERMNQLEESLLKQEHLTNPAEFELQLLSISKYFRDMSDEDRDYLNYARIAMEDKLEWKVDIDD